MLTSYTWWLSLFCASPCLRLGRTRVCTSFLFMFHVQRCSNGLKWLYLKMLGTPGYPFSIQWLIWLIIMFPDPKRDEESVARLELCLELAVSLSSWLSLKKTKEESHGSILDDDSTWLYYTSVTLRANTLICPHPFYTLPLGWLYMQLGR